MDLKIEKLIAETTEKDNKIRLNALNKLLEITEKKVMWDEQIYSDFKNRLKSENSYQRSIGMMLLCNLAKSDTNNYLEKSLSEILQLLEDEKFITRRQCIQNIWKIAIENSNHENKIIESLEKKYKNCLSEDHYNLIRQDIISTLFAIHKNGSELCSISMIESLIEAEEDRKLQKKYNKILET